MDYPFNVAIRPKPTGAHKERADAMRLLIECCEGNPQLSIRLPDDALVCLAEVLFEWEPGSIGGDALRRRTRASMDDESIDDPDSARRFGIIRFP